jgi:two-component system, NarL family, nitrate/nitrite response regulator NarL
VNRPPRPISLVLADDHPVVLQGFARIIDAQEDFDICATCENGCEALAMIRQHRPDVAVLDIAMPGMDGLAVLAQVNTEGLGTRIVLLTANATDSNILAAVEHGARGLLLKDAAIGKLIGCIRTVAGGSYDLPLDLVAEAVEREIGRRTIGEQFVRALSQREREVLLLVMQGLQNKDVARRLNLSEGTVRIHMHNIYQKTGIGSRAALIALSLAHRDLLSA